MPVTHENRIQNAINVFEEANGRMVRLLEGLSDDAARRAPGDGKWNAAQVGYHVAVTNELFAGILSGGVPLTKPAPDGFVENPAVFQSIPESLQTLPPLEPPAAAARDEAIAKLRSAQAALVAAMKALPPARATSEILQLPFGTINMYQAAEFTGAHVHRHLDQINRCTAGA